MLTDKSLSCPSVKATGSHSGSALRAHSRVPGCDERAQGTNLQTGTQRLPGDSSLPEKILAPLWARRTPGTDTKQAHTHNPEHAST